MSATTSTDSPKIPKVTGYKGYAVWSIYVRELMRNDGVLHVLTEDPPNLETASSASVTKFRKEDAKARPHIVLNLGEEPTTLVTAILLADATTKEVWKKLSDAYMKENIQSKLNLRTQLHNLV